MFEVSLCFNIRLGFSKDTESLSALASSYSQSDVHHSQKVDDLIRFLIPEVVTWAR